MADHLVKLTWGVGRGREETLKISPEMTMKDLGVKARSFMLGCCDEQPVELITMGIPRKVLDLSDDAKARSVVPHMTRIQCKLVIGSNSNSKKRLHQEATTAVSGESSRNKKREFVVDLTSSDDEQVETAPRQLVDTSGDEELARRLQQQENETAAAAPQQQQQRRRHVAAMPPCDDADVDPTTVTDVSTPWIYKYGPQQNEDVLGKWLVFCSAERVYQVWKSIYPSIESGALGSPAAKVSTRGKNPQRRGGNRHVICVYTCEQRMDEVGMNLIQIVRGDRGIHYKTDEATEQGIYAETIEEDDEIAHKSLYWNRGFPTFTKPPTMTAVRSQSLAKKAAAAANNNTGSSSLLNHRQNCPMTLVGMKHNVSLAQQQRFLVEGVTTVSLVREPSNRFDSNAIRVDAQLGGSTEPRKLGYIIKQEAALLAPWLDRNLLRIESAKIHLRSGDSTMFLDVVVRACEQAREMLQAL